MKQTAHMKYQSCPSNGTSSAAWRIPYLVFNEPNGISALIPQKDKWKLCAASSKSCV